MNTNASDPMTTTIGNSLTYLGCIMSSGKLPDVRRETLEKFFKGEEYVFPDGSRIVYKGERIRVVAISTEENKKFWIKNADLVRYIEFFINELAFVQALIETPAPMVDADEQDVRQLMGVEMTLLAMAA